MEIKGGVNGVRNSIDEISQINQLLNATKRAEGFCNDDLLNAKKCFENTYYCLSDEYQKTSVENILHAILLALSYDESPSDIENEIYILQKKLRSLINIYNDAERKSESFFTKLESFAGNVLTNLWHPADIFPALKLPTFLTEGAILLGAFSLCSATQYIKSGEVSLAKSFDDTDELLKGFLSGFTSKKEFKTPSEMDISRDFANKYAIYKNISNKLLELSNKSFVYNNDVVVKKISQKNTASPENITEILNRIGSEIDDLRTNNQNASFIRIDKLTSGGESSYIVYIHGTTSFSRNGGSLPTDLVADIQSSGDSANAVTNAIYEAMEQMGIKKSDNVLLAGHSLGGIVAAQVAQNSKNNIKSIITVGSPISLFNIPEKTSVLAMETNNDLVPKLSGKSNPDLKNWITIIEKIKSTDIGVAHDRRTTYKEMAQKIDKSKNKSIQYYFEANKEFFNKNASCQTTFFEYSRKSKGVN